MAKPFYTDNMTVNEILSLGDDVLNSLDRRDLSRALRTVSLAANKRINRLLNKAEKQVDEKTGDVRYVEKGNKGIDFEALYFTGGKKFGKGRKADRNEIYKEFAKVRKFMAAESTTISGAVALRQKRERAVFGKTREELTEGMTPEEAKKAVENMTELTSDVYSNFHKWKEEQALKGGYDKATGKRVIKMLARRMGNKGMSAEEARQSVHDYYKNKYEEAVKVEEDIQKDSDPFELLEDSQKDYWEEDI